MNLPRPLSHSSISMFNECPQRYKLKYIDGIKEKPKHYFSFGVSVHAALEYLYAAPAKPTLDALLTQYDLGWIRDGYHSEAEELKHWEQGRKIVSTFYLKHAAEQPTAVEYGFNIVVDGVPVTGKIDRIDAEPDGRIAITDYKTGKAFAAGRADGDAQLTMYQLACEADGQRVARLALYHLPSGKVQASERHGQALVDDLRRRIVDTAEAISAGRFDPKPSEQACKWCDYKSVCPVFRRKP